MFLSDEVEIVTAIEEGIPNTIPVISIAPPFIYEWKDLVISFSNLTLMPEEQSFSKVSPLPILTHMEASLSGKELSDKILLSCGCRVMLSKLMFLVGLQVIQGKEVLCPVHHCKHDLSNSDYFQAKSVLFIKSLSHSK